MAAKKTTKTTAAKKATSPKTAKAKKAPAKKATTKAPAKKKDGLRKAQIAILKYLAKQSTPKTRTQIAKGAEVDSAGCTEWIGSTKDEVRLANDEKHFKSLVSLKLVKQGQHDVNGKSVIAYSITATGKKQAAKA